MKTIPKLIVAGCLAFAAPLALACEGKHCDHKNCGERGGWFFQEMDKNGDGAISKKEFDAFHAAHFKEVDANHDNKITRDEMDAVHRKMMEQGKARFYQRFDEADADHDGAVSKAEAEKGMPMLFAHFDETDANKDGKVTKEELADSMKRMHEQRQEMRGERMMQRGKE